MQDPSVLDLIIFHEVKNSLGDYMTSHSVKQGNLRCNDNASIMIVVQRDVREQMLLK
jgi:hypothetical protein